MDHTSRADSGWDVLMPMHLRVGHDGSIRHAGPTLHRLAAGRPLVGSALFDAFTIRRPRGIADMTGLAACAGRPLALHWNGPCATQFKGIAVPDPTGPIVPGPDMDAGSPGQRAATLSGRRDPGHADDRPAGGMVVNLSFGIALVDAIRDHDLKAGDFAATDLAVEMLYVLEAKATILEEWRKLNGRLHAARLAAEEQAYTDTLTGVGNRRAMDHVLARLVADGQAFGMIHLDLDFFKQVNDTLGHAAGDHVLQVAARAMADATRAEDTLVRAGGDEFVLILPGQVDGARLRDLAERLIVQLQRPIPFEDHLCRISGSAGIAVSHGGDMTEVEILRRADAALYAAKEAGRGHAVAYGDLPGPSERQGTGSAA